jgi:hypothetical protein
MVKTQLHWRRARFGLQSRSLAPRRRSHLDRGNKVPQSSKTKQKKDKIFKKNDVIILGGDDGHYQYGRLQFETGS